MASIALGSSRIPWVRVWTARKPFVLVNSLVPTDVPQFVQRPSESLLFERQFHVPGMDQFNVNDEVRLLYVAIWKVARALALRDWLAPLLFCPIIVHHLVLCRFHPLFCPYRCIYLDMLHPGYVAYGNATGSLTRPRCTCLADLTAFGNCHRTCSSAIT